jgi:hypothetical protein
MWRIADIDRAVAKAGLPRLADHFEAVLEAQQTFDQQIQDVEEPV